MNSQEREHALTQQITVFTVCSGMIGVCLTAISLVLVAKKVREFRTFCDALLVIDMLIFLVAGIASYVAFRLNCTGRWRTYHLIADVLTLIGMIGMAGTSVLLVWALL
jgi:hypothetical protein